MTKPVTGDKAILSFGREVPSRVSITPPQTAKKVREAVVSFPQGVANLITAYANNDDVIIWAAGEGDIATVHNIMDKGDAGAYLGEAIIAAIRKKHVAIIGRLSGVITKDERGKAVIAAVKTDNIAAMRTLLTYRDITLDDYMSARVACGINIQALETLTGLCPSFGSRRWS